MTNENSDFSAKRRYYTEYYQINSIPETMFLIEKEWLETTANKTKNPQSSVKGVMFALGVIITLIIGSTWQLYRSLKATPVNSQITPSTELTRTLNNEGVEKVREA